MTTRLSVDRFEGEGKQTAVLVTDDGLSLNFPRALLPRGCRAGDVVSLTVERDAEETRRVADAARKVQDELKRRDGGEDLAL